MEDKFIVLEKYRKRALFLLIVDISVSFMFAFFILSLLKELNEASFVVSMFLGVFLAFVLYHATGCGKAQKKFKELFKKLFVEEPFSRAFGQVTYKYDQGIEKERLDETDMILLGNRYYTNDYVQGYYKNVRFERADIKIQQHTSSGKHSHTVTYFNGRYLIFEFNKEFHCDLQIIGNGFDNPQKNNSIFTNKEERRHKIELEDINFNEMFQVLGQDDHEAFYIITPHFMEVLKGLYHSMDGELMLCFVDNQLHVAINTERDAMESSIFFPVEQGEVGSDVQNEINAIINIIDSLCLDRDIYKI